MSALPDDLEPVIAASERERRTHDVEMACRDNGHAWLGAVDGDPIHGVCGHCPCGSQLYDLSGQEISE